MSEFNIKKNKVKPAVSALQSEARSVMSVSMTVADIRNCLAFQGSASNNVRLSLKNIVDTTSEEASKLSGMSTALDNILSAYEKAEVKVVDHAKGRRSVGIGAYILENIGEHPAIPWTIGGIAVLNPGLGLGIGAFSVLQCFRSWWTDETVSHWGLEANGWTMKDKSFTGGIDFEKWVGKDGKLTGLGEAISKFNKDHSKSGEYTFKDGKWQKKEDEDPEGILSGIDVKVASVGVGKERSLWQIEGIAGDKDGTHASGKLRAGNFDTEASAYIGLLSAGVSAGVSVSAFKAEGEAQVGNKWAGLYAQGDVELLKAELKGDASIGLLDKNGKINPNVHVGASAEAIAAEASAKVGGKLLGTDVGAKVGVNVGVGAHADIGFKEGKFSLDVGASLGVGVSAKIEIDVSGTVDAVTGFAVSAVDTVGEAIGSAGKAIGDFGKGVANFFGF